MKLIRKIVDLNKAIVQEKGLGFVPTMGGLHKGHVSLINISKKRCKKTLVSIFVNPSQFNSKKDYKTYPRNLNKDIKLLKKLKIDYLFIPSVDQIYGKKKLNKILLKKSQKILCAKFRKGHFEGVLDVLDRFIELISPQKMFMGEKDFQQFFLVKNFIENKYNTKVYMCKTVRNKKKLALSSRNSLLNKQSFATSEIITKKYPDYSSHDYAPLTNGTPKTYEVRLSGTAAWGTTVTTKNITMPYSEISFDNPEGEYYFVPRDGYWSGTPVSYKWIFTGDSENNIQAQISSNYTTIPFLVSGFTSSKLTQLKQYGPNPYIEGVPVFQKGEILGYVKNLGPDYTGYTYLNTLYYDFPQGYTLFIANSSGLTENNITPVPIVKEEILIGMVNATEIQSNVFINRGKLSGTESLLRLGEIDNLGDLIKYGYGYFKLTEQ